MLSLMAPPMPCLVLLLPELRAGSHQVRLPPLDKMNKDEGLSVRIQHRIMGLERAGLTGSKLLVTVLGEHHQDIIQQRAVVRVHRLNLGRAGGGDRRGVPERIHDRQHFLDEKPFVPAHVSLLCCVSISLYVR